MLKYFSAVIKARTVDGKSLDTTCANPLDLLRKATSLSKLEHGTEKTRAEFSQALRELQSVKDLSEEAKRISPEAQASITERALDWMMSKETGSSSISLCAHMLGKETAYMDYPHDPSDLRRCLILLRKIPEWSNRIQEMAVYGPGWSGIVSQWDTICSTLEQEVGMDWDKQARATRTFRAMRSAIADGYRNDPNYQCTFDKNGWLASATYLHDCDDEEEDWDLEP